jgi:hypothetical protein
VKLKWLIDGLIVGAIGMYFMDPDRGRKRRHELRDRARSRVKRVQRNLNAMVRDFGNRSHGVIHDVKQLRNHEEVSNDVLMERLRSNLGRCVSHPAAVHVEATDGHVTLSGDILANEVEDAVHCVKRLAKGKSVVNELNVHSASEKIPALQGDGHVSHSTDRWTPATSLIMCVLGAGLTIVGSRKRSLLGIGMAAVGTGMISRAFSDTEHRNEPRRTHSKAQPQVRRELAETIGRLN